MQYDPKLKVAMAEIKAIIEKHDVGAFVVLHRPGFAEFLNKIDPSYSCAKIDRGGQLVFRALASELGGKFERNKAIADTYNLFSNMVDVIGQNWLMYDEGLKLLPPHEETRGNVTGHDEQNN